MDRLYIAAAWLCAIAGCVTVLLGNFGVVLWADVRTAQGVLGFWIAVALLAARR